jgi:hypothetical protein
MNTDMKWAALAFFFILGVPMAGLALKEYHIHQCRVEGIRANMEPEKIAQVCR